MSFGGIANKTLARLQNRAVRILTSSSYDTNADDVIARLGWNKLDVQLKFKTAVMGYKSLNGLAPDYLRTMFSNRGDTYTYSLRGSVGKLTVPLPRTNFLTVLAIEVRCCGTVYLSTCGKHKLLLVLNPAAVGSFLARINVNTNNTRHSWKVGISFIIINYRILS